MDRGHHRPHLKGNLITTLKWQVKLNLLATAVVQLNLLLTAAEQRQLFDDCHWAEKPIMP